MSLTKQQQKEVKTLEVEGSLSLEDKKRLTKIVMERNGNTTTGKIYLNRKLKLDSNAKYEEKSSFEGTPLDAIDYFVDLAILIIMKEDIK